MDILSARKKAAERAKKKGIKTAPAAGVTPAPAEEAARPQEPREPRFSGAEVAGEAVAPSPADVQQAEEPAPGQVAAPRKETGEEEAGESPVQELEMLAFRLGNEEYVVLVEQVREVLKLWEVTPVPHTPEYVLGVTPLRGKALPVVDLCKRLGIAPGIRDEKSRVIVVSLDDEETGLLVDRVMGVVRFLPDAVRPAPETIEQGAGAEFLRGIVRKDDKLYILLDLEKAVA